MTVAVGLLTVAGVGVGVALGVGAVLPLRIAAVAAVVAAVAATLILTDELTNVRRSTAAELAQQAKAYQQTAAARAREDAVFTRRLAARIGARDLIILRLRRALRMALRRMDEASDRAQRYARIVAELRATVHQLQLRLDAATGAQAPADEQQSWDDEAPTVVDLVGWDQRANVSAVKAAQAVHPHRTTRKHA